MSLNMSTGPVEVSRAVLEAQLEPMLSPHRDTFWELHDQTMGLLQTVLRTQQRVMMMHGSIRSGIDVAMGNLMGPGTRVLAIQNGFWGALLGDWAQLRGANVTTLAHGPLEAVDLGRVADALRKDRFDIVIAVHVETNSGIVNPIEEIGKLCADTDALYFVDTACSAGAMPVETDLWNIDVQTTGSHKCLASVPGLSIVTLSEKAWRRVRSSGMGAYFDFHKWWAATVERSNAPPFTQPTPLVLALRQSLLEITAGGMETAWNHHERVATAFMDRLRKVGFNMLLDEAPTPLPRTSYSDTVIAVAYPQGLNDAAFRKSLQDEFGIFVIGNIGVFAGRSFRIGLMSAPQLATANVDATIAAIDSTAKALLSAATSRV